MVDDSNKPLMYQESIELAYKAYSKLRPLDLQYEKANSSKFRFWQENFQYDICEFSRKIDCMKKSKDLDDFTHRSHSDFDNAAIVIQAALESNLVHVENGTISPTKEKTKQNLKNIDAKESFMPKSVYNQFPCDQKSVSRRVSFILNRYPHVNNIEFGLIGDDDFTSIQLSQHASVNLTVLETDAAIIDQIQKVSPSVTIEEFDIRNVASEKLNGELQSFMTDPPYTLHGSLAFIYCGISKLQPRRGTVAEFYVILNQTMMGRNLHRMLNILSDAGIYLTDVAKDFSQYKLPESFSEYVRAKDFVSQMGMEDTTEITYSSSSNIYTFTLGENFDPEVLKKIIQPEKMYAHYEY